MTRTQIQNTSEMVFGTAKRSIKPRCSGACQGFFFAEGGGANSRNPVTRAARLDKILAQFPIKMGDERTVWRLLEYARPPPRHVPDRAGFQIMGARESSRCDDEFRFPKVAISKIKV